VDTLTDSDTIAVFTVLADQDHYLLKQLLPSDLPLEICDAEGLRARMRPF